MKMEEMGQQPLGRREFNKRCVALGLSLPAITAMIAGASTLAAASDAASNGAGRAVKFPDGTIVPAVGQGSAHLGQGRHSEAVEEEALRTGLSLGMTLIDTAGGYGDGRSEELIGRVIAGQRDRVFLVSKVTPYRATRSGIARACEASLARLSTYYLDLYLLHWRNPDPDLSGVVSEFESLREARKIRAWGVSNFNVSDMEDLFSVPHGDRCAINQVYYNIGGRGVEYDLLPWCNKRGMPVMAYAPLGHSTLVSDPTLARIGAAHGCSASAVALAWVIRSGNVVAIPESGSPAHVKENAAALSLMLTPEELQILDAAYPLRWVNLLRPLLDRSKRWLRNWL